MFHGVIQKITLAQFFLRHGVLILDINKLFCDTKMQHILPGYILAQCMCNRVIFNGHAEQKTLNTVLNKYLHPLYLLCIDIAFKSHC